MPRGAATGHARRDRRLRPCAVRNSVHAWWATVHGPDSAWMPRVGLPCRTRRCRVQRHERHAAESILARADQPGALVGIARALSVQHQRLASVHGQRGEALCPDRGRFLYGACFQGPRCFFQRGRKPSKRSNVGGASHCRMWSSTATFWPRSAIPWNAGSARRLALVGPRLP